MRQFYLPFLSESRENYQKTLLCTHEKNKVWYNNIRESDL